MSNPRIFKPPALLTAKQVAQRLGCSRRHVYNIIAAGGMKTSRIGDTRGLRIAADELEGFLERRRVDPHV